MLKMIAQFFYDIKTKIRQNSAKIYRKFMKNRQSVTNIENCAANPAGIFRRIRSGFE